MKIYNLIYGKINEMAFKSNQSKFKFDPKKKQWKEDRKETTSSEVPVISNANYYIFAGGTKPFHAGHYMLMSNIINNANNDMSGKKPIVIFYIGLGSRGGTEDQVEIKANDVYDIWKQVVEPQLQTLANDNVDVYVEYGGGPVQKVIQLKRSLNTGEINQSKIIVYSDDEDVEANYYTPQFYKKDETERSIAKKRIENPDYQGYKMGQESPHSPPLSDNFLRKIRSKLDVFKALNPEMEIASDFVLDDQNKKSVDSFLSSNQDNLYNLPGDIIYPGSLYPDVGERIASGTEVRQAAMRGDIDSIKKMLPDFVVRDPEKLKIYLLKLGLDEELIENALMTEIKRAEKGTHEYSNYLEELMSELQHVKSSYDSRKKSGARYRKEASKIQDAYSELRRLKRKNDKILNAQKLNEAFNQSGYRVDVKISKEPEFNTDDMRSFFRRFK